MSPTEAGVIIPVIEADALERFGAPIPETGF